MSTTYHIGCKTCKEHLWIAQTGHVKGQDPNTYLYVYSGDQATMNTLSSFLQKHKTDSSLYLRYTDELPEHELVFGHSGLFWDQDDWIEIDTTTGEPVVDEES